jgi:hypothetical protein
VALREAILLKRKQLLDWEVKHIQEVREGKLDERKSKPSRPSYIHLLNLRTLFEFCITVIQDYGLALKSNDWTTFKSCTERLFLLYCSFTSKGAADYQAGMYCYLRLLDYWESHQLPIVDLLKFNHTVFSEESGEIALGTLTALQPPNTSSDISVTRQYWQLIRMRFSQLHGDDAPSRSKLHRQIGTSFFFFTFVLLNRDFNFFLSFFRAFFKALFLHGKKLKSSLTLPPYSPWLSELKGRN